MKFQSIKKSFIDIWQILKPSSNDEKYIFLSLFFYFTIIATVFCVFVLPPKQSLGMLGYDTEGHLTYEPMMISANNMLKWNLRHPLYRLFFLPIILINEGFLACGVNITWELFLGTSTILMSCSGLFIYKTLRAINNSIIEAIILLLLFCSFAHVIMLSFQVDSFVMSMFFCSIMLLLFVKKSHNQLSDILLFLGITGTTSTNCIKYAFYIWIEEHSLKRAFIRFSRSTFIFCILFSFTFVNLIFRLIERPRGFLYAIIGDSLNFQGTSISKWHLFISNFLSEPLLFHHTKGIIYSQETTILPEYPSMFYYIPIIIITLLVTYSIFNNRHNTIIQFICCCFVFDLFMHFGIGYGIEEAQLFCGHWIFYIPIIIGIQIVKMKRYRITTPLILHIITIYFFIHNLSNYIQSL